jgi:hypothetical protein
MSVDDIRLVRYGEIDVGRLDALLASEYPAQHDVRKRAFLDWLYCNNPAGEGRFVLAVDADGSYRGVTGVVPFVITVGTDTMLAHLALHVLVHREYRKENLFGRMIRVLTTSLEPGPAWLFGHPNANALPFWKRHKMAFRPDYVLAWNRRIFDARLRRYQTIESRKQLVDLDFSSLREWRQALGTPVLASEADFLAWRFLDHPTRRYRVAVRLEGPHVKGYCVIAKDLRPGIDVIVDYQGSQETAQGPPGRMSRLSFTTWRPTDAGASSGRLVKRIAFFATGIGVPRSLAATSWDRVSLAACDFL